MVVTRVDEAQIVGLKRHVVLEVTSVDGDLSHEGVRRVAEGAIGRVLPVRLAEENDPVAQVRDRAERVMESVYYKILGAGRRFVFTVFTLENLLIGLLSSTLALAMGQAGAYWVCALKLDIGYRPFLPESLAMAGLTVLLVIIVGMAASRSIMIKKPVTYLREQHNG